MRKNNKTLDDWIFIVFISWLLFIGTFMYGMTIYMRAWILTVLFAPLMVIFVLIGTALYKDNK